jgi:hypothetical protein
MGRQHTINHLYDPFLSVRRTGLQGTAGRTCCRADINASKQEVPILFPQASDLVQSIENQILNIPLDELFAIARSLSEKGLIGNPSISDFIISRKCLPTVLFDVEWCNIRSSIKCKSATANDVVRYSLYQTPIPVPNNTAEHSVVIGNLFRAGAVVIDAEDKAVQQKAIDEMSSLGNVVAPQRREIPLHLILN